MTGADARLRTAQNAITEILAAVQQQGRRGAFWLPRLRDLRDTLHAPDRPAEQALADAAAMFDLLYAAPRDNFADFYLDGAETPQRAAANRQYCAAVDALNAALHDT